MITETKKAELLEAIHRRILAKNGSSGSAEQAPENRGFPARPAPSGAGDGGKATVTAGGKVPPARTNPNRAENEFMLNLMVLRNSLKKYAPECRARARRAGKWVWRDIRLLDTLVDRIQRQLLDTMPERREEYYLSYCKHGHYELVINGPVRGTRYVLISDRHLAELTESAMEAECMLCFREGSEIRNCLLRKAMLEVAPPTELQDGLWEKCEYREAARQVMNDEDVKI